MLLWLRVGPTGARPRNASAQTDTRSSFDWLALNAAAKGYKDSNKGAGLNEPLPPTAVTAMRFDEFGEDRDVIGSLVRGDLHLINNYALDTDPAQKMKQREGEARSARQPALLRS